MKEATLLFTNLAMRSDSTTPSRVCAPFLYPLLFLGHTYNLGSYLRKLDTPDVDTPCDVCAEFARFPTDAKGDLCSDTPPTIENYKCQDPEELDCNYQQYVDTAFMYVTHSVLLQLAGTPWVMALMVA